MNFLNLFLLFIIYIKYASSDDQLQCFRTEMSSFLSYQIIVNTFANLANESYTLCCGDISDCSLPIHTISGVENRCSSGGNILVCIGSLNQQHACSAAGTLWDQVCTQIDWSVKSQNCSDHLLYYFSFQKIQPDAACCNDSNCVPTNSVNGSPWSCSGGDALWVCVNSGYGVECVNPATNDICSGNYTSQASQSTIITSADSSSLIETNTNMFHQTLSSTQESSLSTSSTGVVNPNTISGSSNISDWKTIVIVVCSIIGAIVSILGLYITWRKLCHDQNKD